MGMSYGNVLAQGILGAVMGGAQGVAKVAEDERKSQMEELREKRLSALRMQEYRVKGQIDTEQRESENAKRAEFYQRTEEREVETPGVEVDESGKEIGPITGLRNESPIETAQRRAKEAKKTGDKTLIDQTTEEERKQRDFEDKRDERRERREERRETREERAADRRETREDRAAARREAREDREAAREDRERLAREARQGRWIVDGDGNYRRPDGSLVTEEIREGGRLLGTRPIKAPDSKVKVRPEVYSVEDEVRQIDREIMVARRSGDRDEVDRLNEEKRRLLGRPAGSTAGAGKPWERSWSNR